MHPEILLSQFLCPAVGRPSPPHGIPGRCGAAHNPGDGTGDGTGLHTASFKAPGCSPVSSSRDALPRSIWAAYRIALARAHRTSLPRLPMPPQTCRHRRGAADTALAARSDADPARPDSAIRALEASSCQFLRHQSFAATVICRHQHQPLSHGAGGVWHDADDLLLSPSISAKRSRLTPASMETKQRQTPQCPLPALPPHRQTSGASLPQNTNRLSAGSLLQRSRWMPPPLRTSPHAPPCSAASHGHRRPAHGLHRCPRQSAAHISSADKTGLILICHTPLLTGSVHCPE